MKIKERLSSKKRIRMCGFRKRMSTRGGRKIINSRRRLGKRLCVSKPKK